MYQDQMKLKWFSRPQKNIVTESHKEKKQEEEFAEKLDLIEKKYADRLDRREREILERLDHVDNELAKRLGFVETESAVRLGKFQAKLNACNTRLSNVESCIPLCTPTP
ncbi:hypothetical protein PBCVFr5L_958R [Paramecium bursaria Chlorella virus Fr5L]|nr:hypothetical protein PBCVFr5L_958R [Paramecium bursaria Chlorella virus Fr5L]